jgi:hypothetical protein
MKLLAILFAFALIAAACGGDDDDNASSDDDGDTVLGDEDDAPAPEPEPEPEPEPAGDDGGEEPAPEPAPAGDDGDDPPPAPEMVLLSDDAVDGGGANAFEAAIQDGLANPLAADESLEPVSIFVVNLEGDPGGSFPEVSEGMRIARDFINDNLGGVGGDYMTRTGGRPLEIEVCAHLIDAAEAQACANEAATSGANLIVPGIDFFTPLMYPVWTGAGLPVFEFLPIFIADFDTTGIFALTGGCVSAFPGAVQEVVRERGHDYVAVPYSDNAPGQECYSDTQERPLQYLLNQGEIVGFKGYPDLPGDPSDNDANVQQILADIEASGATNPAIHYGIQASDCAEYQDSFAAAGNDALTDIKIYASGSCVDDAVLTSDTATGIFFGFSTYLPEEPQLYSDYVAWELNWREDTIDNSGTSIPKSTFMRGGFNMSFYVQALLGEMMVAGEDVDDPAAVSNKFATTPPHHKVGGPPLDCSAGIDEFESICEFNWQQNKWTGDGWELDVEGFTDGSSFVREFSEGLPRS